MPRTGRPALQHRVGTFLVCLCSVALLTACGAPATPAPTASAKGDTTEASAAPHLAHVTLRQAWLVSGYGTPFILAKEEGLYSKAGLDVAIPEGKGSLTTAETVANGSDTFGFTDAGVAAALISKGAPLKVLAVYLQQTPNALFYVPGKESLNSPTSLIGKTLLVNPSGSPYQLLAAVLARYHIRPAQIHEEVTPASEWASAMAKDPSAYTIGLITALPNLRQLVPGAQAVSYAHFGVNTYSIALVTSTAELHAHPGQVRRFVAATTQGWQAAIKDPAAAVKATLRAFPHANAKILEGSLAESLKLLHTPNTAGHVVGWMSARDWRETLALLHTYAGMAKVLPLNDYYTNSFLPAS